MITQNKQSILYKLYESKQNNAMLIRALERFPDTEQHTVNNSTAVYEPKSKSYLFNIADEGEFTELHKCLEHPLETFYVNTCKCFDEIKSVLPDVRAQQYIQYNIGRYDFIANGNDKRTNAQIVPISEDWIEFILSLYKSPEFGHYDYIKQCIDENPGYGALINGERVGYVLIHLDGEIGSMVIAPQARGKGIGQALMQYITPDYCRQASMGCGFVLPGNINSQQMMVKSCFVPLDKYIMWVYHQ